MADTADWNKRFDNIRLADIEYIEKNTNDILDSIDFADETERLLCKDIIQHLEQTTADEVKNGKCVQIPFIGSIRKNPMKQVLEDNRANFRQIAKNNTKEEAKKQFAFVFKQQKDELRREDYYKAKLKEVRNRHKDKYERYYKLIGPAYANMFLVSRLHYTPVEFDKELEDKLQELNNG